MKIREKKVFNDFDRKFILSFAKIVQVAVAQ
jgi:hypothetical protein